MQAAAKRSLVIEGSITPTDLLALIREKFHVPDGATTTFHTLDTGSLTGGLLQHVGWHPASAPAMAQITDGNPIRFRVEWSLPVGKDEQG